ncbi:NAD-dependent epimerase/dehydratase family protein [Pectobacterium versatile]|uniref:NAD-dependent epimerase/dehydratase family protein n=1 Tax=Pectobacterium versatile TaxID=2488639 RepID=UPI001CF2B7E2|nr:NAD(P)-dependent oxidoreductase [Pectobacterium versatile]UCP81539.1 NAD(P)-dependent oxidoreductase [Pectobacterium versatile]
MMKKIVIFGATGTVGTYTAIELKRKGYYVIAVGRRVDKNNFFMKRGIEYYSLDVREKKSFSLLPKDVDSVIHLAGAMPAHMDNYVPDSYLSSILTGTFNVLEYIRENNIRKIIFGHSISDILYRFGTKDPISPDVDMKFPLTGDHSIYSISKNAAVNLIEHYHFQYGVNRYILRMPTIYAYHPNSFYYVDGKKKKMGFRLIIENAMQAKTIEIWGDPTKEKEIVYIKDFIKIVEGAIESSSKGGIYNVGTGIGVSLEKQVRDIIKIFSPKGSESNVVYKENYQNSPQFILDIDKTRLELNFSPDYDYISYLIDFKKEMESQRFKEIWGDESEYD